MAKSLRAKMSFGKSALASQLNHMTKIHAARTAQLRGGMTAWRGSGTKADPYRKVGVHVPGGHVGKPTAKSKVGADRNSGTWITRNGQHIMV